MKWTTISIGHCQIMSDMDICGPQVGLLCGSKIDNPIRSNAIWSELTRLQSMSLFSIFSMTWFWPRTQHKFMAEANGAVTSGTSKWTPALEDFTLGKMDLKKTQPKKIGIDGFSYGPSTNLKSTSPQIDHQKSSSIFFIWCSLPQSA